MSPYGSYVVETLVTLLGVSALAFLLLYGARKAGLGRATGSVSLIGRLPLDARRSVLLVQVGPTVFVVGVSEAGLTKLGEMPATDVPPVSAVDADAAPFASVLKNVLGRR